MRHKNAKKYGILRGGIAIAMVSDQNEAERHILQQFYAGIDFLMHNPGLNNI